MIAEDLLLLLLDDQSGARTADGTALDYALAGALMIELALQERIRVDDNPKPKRRLIEVVQPGPTGDDLLDRALAVIGEKPRRAEELVPKLVTGLRETLLTRLVARGVLQEQTTKVLGVFTRHRWPAADSEHESEVRERLRGILVTGLTPDENSGALVALLSAIDKAHTVVGELDKPTRKLVRDRAKSVAAEESWAADAVKAAVTAVQEATMVAIVASTVVTTSATSAG